MHEPETFWQGEGRRRAYTCLWAFLTLENNPRNPSDADFAYVLTERKYPAESKI
jgi:hypothetical protein